MFDKLLSGRFIFTIVTSYIFFDASAKGLLNADQIVTIILIVGAFYFNKKQGD